MEENKTTVAQETPADGAKLETKTEPKAEPKTEPKAEPNIQELMTELAKYKRQADKNASEAAEYKRKWKDSLTEVEKASMEKAEKEAARDEEFNRLKRENDIHNLEKQYRMVGYTEEEASRMAIAEADGDVEAKIKIMVEVDGRKKKDAEAEWLAKRPDVNVGGGTGVTVTKEQFDAMNPVELTKLKRENRAEYDRLIAM